MHVLHLKQPKGFYAIAFGELCERFSYYGAQTLLVLYLTTKFFLNDDKSFSLYGAYAAFSYALPVLGGLAADRLLGLKQSIIIGGLLLIVGNILMGIPTLNCFYIGLGLTACGIGLYKPNSSSLIGKLQNGTSEKSYEDRFTLFYLGMNIGATISPFIYGLVKYWGYQYGYFISAILLFISWLWFVLKNYPTINKVDTLFKLSANCLGYGLIVVVIVLVNILFLFANLMDTFLGVFAVITLTLLMIMICKRESKERNRLFALIMLSIFGMGFFAASLQLGSSINLFIQRDVYRVVWGWRIPTLMFMSLYPFAVVVFAPIITLGWRFLEKLTHVPPSPPFKISISLLLGGVAFLCFVFSAMGSEYNTVSHLPIMWIVLGNLSLGAGEVCVIPVMLSTISRCAPADVQSTMIGIWYLFIAFGGYLSGLAAKIDIMGSILTSTSIYAHAFLKISLAMFLLALLLFFLTPVIKSFLQK